MLRDAILRVVKNWESFPTTKLLAMKKKLIVVGAALGVIVGAGISMIVWKALTITDPYIVTPLTSSPAPVGMTVGHSFESAFAHFIHRQQQ